MKKSEIVRKLQVSVTKTFASLQNILKTPFSGPWVKQENHFVGNLVLFWNFFKDIVTSLSFDNWTPSIWQMPVWFFCRPFDRTPENVFKENCFGKFSVSSFIWRKCSKKPFFYLGLKYFFPLECLCNINTSWIFELKKFREEILSFCFLILKTSI